MSRIRVGINLEATPREVWDDIRHLESHVEWMHDAVAIRFTSKSQAGVGTTFDCDTRVGPLHLTDKMEVTEWKPRRAIGIQHVGLVTGTGRFRLRRRWRGGGTRFTWEERIVFPWQLGGPVGAFFGSVVLRQIWKRNLRNLKRRLDTARAR